MQTQTIIALFNIAQNLFGLFFYSDNAFNIEQIKVNTQYKLNSKILASIYLKI